MSGEGEESAAVQADAVTLQVRALETLHLEALRAEWRRQVGAPPRLRSPELLRRMLAWRLQVERFGGLDDAVRRGLRVTSKPRATPALGVGAVITREWSGRVHAVQVVEGGFLHEGTRHRSLSAVALAITGVSWNGPRFFGLRQAKAAGSVVS